MANRGPGGVRGPKSALTDFLAEHNISAAGIVNDMRRRQDVAIRLQQEEALRSQQEGSAAATSNDAEEVKAKSDGDEEEEDEIAQAAAEARSTRKRKRKEQQAIENIKKSKKLAKEKAKKNGDLDDEGLGDGYKKAKPLPGQMENCEECNVRFTVTAYTRQGAVGGLLCSRCGKKYEAADKKKKATQKKQAAPKGVRSIAQSYMLDGYSPFGARSLRHMCVERIKNSIDDIDDLGEIPVALYDDLSGILSKWRVLNSRTLPLLLKPDHNRVVLYDAAKLTTDDFIRIFQICPRLQIVDLRNCGQLKDNVLDFIMERDIPLRDVRLNASNLVTDAKLQEFFTKLGPRLESLELSWLDISLSNESIQVLVKECPNLKRLKLKLCWLLDNTTLGLLAQLQNLEHLSLEFIKPTDAAPLAELVHTIGGNLRSLSLHNFGNADDSLIAAIGTSCKNLKKLVITRNGLITDDAFSQLFQHSGIPALEKVVLANCRDPSSNPVLPADSTAENLAIGFSSAGFTALMKHSGQRLKKLELVSCRTISHDALFSAFNGSTIYPELTDIDVSFVQKVDDVIVAGMFKSCPKLDRLTAFGCFDILNIRIPRGVSVIGVPSWKDGLIQEGTEDVDLSMMMDL